MAWSAPSAPSGGLFGSSAPTFGAPAQASQPAPSLFGAQPAQQQQPTSLFGAPTTSQPAAGGFNFGAPAGGQQQQTTGAGTGQPGQGPSLFGASQPAAPSSGFSFGGTQQPAASQPGSTGGFNFGGAAQTASPFGAAPASQPATGGFFGSAAAPKPAGTAPGGGFGAFSLGGPAAAPAAGTGGLGGGLFGTAPAAQGAPGSGLLGQAPAEPPEQRYFSDIESMIKAWDKTSGPAYRFRTLVLNVVGPNQRRVRPPECSDSEWQEALDRAGGENNADSLWPVQAVGVSDLLERRRVQEAVLESDIARRSQAAEVLRLHRRNLDVHVAARLENARRRQGELLLRLLSVLRLLDALEGRLAAQLGMGGDRAAVGALFERARGLEAAIEAPQGLQRKVDGLQAALARVQLRAQHSGPGGSRVAGSGLGPGAGSAGESAPDESSLRRLHAVLQAQVEAADRLQSVLARATRDVGILEAEGGAGGQAAHAQLQGHRR